MKEQNSDLPQIRSNLAYFRQVADIHLAIYKAQTLSGLSEYERHIAFCEMMQILQAASIKPDEEAEAKKQDKVLGREKNTVTKSSLEMERILGEFDAAAANPKASGKLANKHWKKISKKFEKTYPNFDHFFKIAEEKYKAIDGLVKFNKANCTDEAELRFLLESQQQARFNIIEMHRLKYETEALVIKDRQAGLNKKQEEITTNLVALRLELSEIIEKENEPEKEQPELNRSLRQSYDTINLKSGDVAAASKSVILLQNQIVKIHQQIAVKQTKKNIVETKIKLLETEQTSIGAACDVLWEEKRKITENYIKAYCNYRQNWIKDDGANTNEPLWNCMALNFKKTLINEGSILSPDTYESALVLDGINFGDIPITLAELATADSASLGKIAGITGQQAIALGKIKQTVILGVKDKSDKEQQNAILQEETKSEKAIQAVNLVGALQNINYNLNIPSNSYLLWLQGGEKWEKLDQEKRKSKDEAVSGRGRALSKLIIRFRSNTAETKAPSDPVLFGDYPIESRDTDDEYSVDNPDKSLSGSESDDDRVESKKGTGNKTLDMRLNESYDDEQEELRSGSESKTPAQLEPSLVTNNNVAKNESPPNPAAEPSKNPQTRRNLSSLFNRKKNEAAEKDAQKPVDESANKPANKLSIIQEPNPYGDTELKPTAFTAGTIDEENKTPSATQKTAKNSKEIPVDGAKPVRSWRDRFLRKPSLAQQTSPAQNVEVKFEAISAVSNDSAFPGMIARDSESTGSEVEFDIDDGFRDLDTEMAQTTLSRNSRLHNKPGNSIEKRPGQSAVQHTKLKPSRGPEEFQEF